MKQVRRRPAAIEDMVRQVAYRRNAAGEAAATALVDEMQACLRSISQENAGPSQVSLRPRGGPGRATPGPWGCSEAPANGSRRIGQLLGVPELQWKRVGKTRLWFWYVDGPTHVDVIRLVSTDQLPRQAMLPDDLH